MSEQKPSIELTLEAYNCVLNIAIDVVLNACQKVTYSRIGVEQFDDALDAINSALNSMRVVDKLKIALEMSNPHFCKQAENPKLKKARELIKRLAVEKTKLENIALAEWTRTHQYLQ